MMRVVNVVNQERSKEFSLFKQMACHDFQINFQRKLFSRIHSSEKWLSVPSDDEDYISDSEIPSRCNQSKAFDCKLNLISWVEIFRIANSDCLLHNLSFNGHFAIFLFYQVSWQLIARDWSVFRQTLNHRLNEQLTRVDWARPLDRQRGSQDGTVEWMEYLLYLINCPHLPQSQLGWFRDNHSRNAEWVI